MLNTGMKISGRKSTTMERTQSAVLKTAERKCDNQMKRKPCNNVNSSLNRSWKKSSTSPKVKDAGTTTGSPSLLSSSIFVKKFLEYCNDLRNNRDLPPPLCVLDIIVVFPCDLCPFETIADRYRMETSQ